MTKCSKENIIPTTTTGDVDPDTTTNCSQGKNDIVKAKRKRKSIPRAYPQQRSSVYRGVTRHRWTGRYEAHLWDKNCWNESQTKKGRQVYLGAYNDEEAAAHAYDLAALKYWGPDTILNYPLSTYEKQLTEMEGQTKEEYIGSLRRKSNGFSRGVSKYRGVARYLFMDTRHHHNGRWEARIGRVFGNKYLYLGTYATQEAAATAYDMAALEYRGLNAVTNFDLSRYIKWLKPLQNNQNDSEQIPNDNNSNNLYAMQNPSDQEIVSSSVNHQVSSSNPIDQTTAGPPRLVSGTTTPSALGLLLQSSKFKEMLEQTAACNSTPSSPSEMDPPRSCFPDDIQTSFEIQDCFAEEHGIIFGDYESFVSPMLQCDLDHPQ